jgi:hypothetical protein
METTWRIDLEAAEMQGNALEGQVYGLDAVSISLSLPKEETSQELAIAPALSNQSLRDQTNTEQDTVSRSLSLPNEAPSDEAEC